jgi:DNA-binding beta-propeller fold protein YncE
MRLRTVAMRCGGALVAMALCAVSRAQEPKPLELTQTIQFPAVQGGFNHMSVDAARQRLYAAMPTNTTVEVADLKAGKPLRSLTGERPAAVRYAPEFDQLYVAQPQGVSIYDGKTLDLIANVDLGSNIDELQYDARAKRLYAGCMAAGKTGVAVIAIPEGKLVAKIALPDKPQGIAVEPGGGRIYANMPTLKQVAVMDAAKAALLAAWPLDGAEGNAPLGLDAARHRLFVGVRRPAQLVVLDTETGRIVAKVDTNNDADDLFYDAAHQRVYVSCGEGFVDVIAQHDADHYVPLARVATVAGARTSTFSPQLNRLYVGVPRRGDLPAEVRVYTAR